MSDQSVVYPFDPTGVAASNLVVNESRAVTPSNFRDYFFIVPQFAPFYADGLVINYTATDGSTRTLSEGDDYYVALPFIGATRSIGLPIYGGIAFNNTIQGGIVRYSYQTLGGEYTPADLNAVMTLLVEQVYNPRITTWDSVTDKPVVFPPINHPVEIDNIFGHQALIDAIISLVNTIANRRTVNFGPGNLYRLVFESNGTVSIYDQNNVRTFTTTGEDVMAYADSLITALVNNAPSNLNTLSELAAAINNDPTYYSTVNTALGTKVNTSAKATTAQAEGGSVDTVWMTPLKTLQAINKFAVTSLPQGTESVSGILELASVAETLAGADATRAVHAVGVKAVVDAAIAAVIDSSPGALDTLNELAAALADDPNFATTVTTALSGKVNISAKATTAQAQTGTDDAAWMTPLKTAQAIASLVPVASETVVGKVELATSGETTTGTDTTRATHPAGVKAAIDAAIAGLVNNAPSNLNTLSELAAAINNDPLFYNTVNTALGTKVNTSAKATTAQAQTGTDDATWMTPLKVAQAITQLSTGAIPIASETTQGKVELANSTETVTGVDTTRATHPAGVKAAIDAAIANLVAAAPGALDTLNELAAALGDDPNFATTMTNLLAGKVNTSALATTIEAQAGTDDTKWMTPLKVAQAITQLSTGAVPVATETIAGKVELATAAETTAGTDTTRAVHPAGLKVELDKKVNTSAKASTVQAQSGTDDATWMTPLKVADAITSRTAAAVPVATETTQGKVELASSAETITGTDATRATHPAGVKAAIDAAITALVSAAPTTLDTLNELAAALGDDPNFATTITNALAGKQASDSTLSALANLTTAANQIIYSTGVDNFAMSTLSVYMRGLLASADNVAVRTSLALGNAATRNVGSGATDVASGDHTHSGYALTSHNHDSAYAALSHQHYDTFSWNVPSPAPTTFPSNSLRGFDAYNSTDFPGMHYSGITIGGSSGVRSAQLAFGWNTEESAPGLVYFRTNDDTADISSWTPWTRLLTSLDGIATSNHTHNSLVNGAYSASLDSAGNLTVSGDIVAFSDARLKDNVKTITNALAICNQLDGVTFNWNNDSNLVAAKTGKADYGVLAHQVKAVMPEIVYPITDNDTGETYDTVAYEKMIPVLLEAIKDLSNKVNAQTLKINELETNIQRLSMGSAAYNFNM